MPTFIGPEDDAIAVLHDAEDAQLDVGQVHPLPVHLQEEKPSIVSLLHPSQQLNQR